MAPELLDANASKEGVSGKACDIWSLGVTFFVFVFLQVPFYGANIFELLEKIRGGELVFPDSREISDDLKNVLRKMLQKNANERISIQFFKKITLFVKCFFKGNWLRSIGLKKMAFLWRKRCKFYRFMIKIYYFIRISLEEIIVNEQDLARALIPIERAFFLVILLIFGIC